MEKHFVYIPIGYVTNEYLQKRDSFFRKAFPSRGNIMFEIVYVIGEWGWSKLNGIKIERDRTLLPADPLGNKGPIVYATKELLFNDKKYTFLVIYHGEYFFSEGIGAKRKVIIYDGVRRGDHGYFSSFDFNAGGAIKWENCPRDFHSINNEPVYLSDCIVDNIRHCRDNVAIVAK